MGRFGCSNHAGGCTLCGIEDTRNEWEARNRRQSVICQNPRQCAEEAAWIHNPHKGWTFLENNICHFGDRKSQAPGYAWPEGDGPILGNRFYSEKVEAISFYANRIDLGVAGNPTKKLIWQRIAEWCFK